MNNKIFVFGCSYATGEELLMHHLGELDSYRIQTAHNPRLFFKKLKQQQNLKNLYEKIKDDQKNIAWPNLLARKLGYECVNLAESGNSLDKILYQLFEEQEKIGKNDITIISLTKPTRNAVFDKTVNSFQLPSLHWPVKSLLGVKDNGDVEPVINPKTDKALLDWFTNDRIAWDFIKNLKLLTGTDAKIIPSMTINIDTTFKLFRNIYEECAQGFITTKSLDDFSKYRHAWGHPDADAHKKYAEHLYEILR